MKEKLLIIGASGHGKVVADIAFKSKKWKYIAFLDDEKSNSLTMDLEVIDSVDKVDGYIADYDIFVAIGNNKTRKRIIEMLENLGASIPILIHPSAIVGQKVEIGSGTVVMAGVIINPCTTIGRGCIINTSSTIDHDNCIKDFVHISPGVHLAGTVRIGNGSWIGIGSIVSNNICITEQCTLGAGTVVIKNLTNSGVYVGVPARKIK